MTLRGNAAKLFDVGVCAYIISVTFALNSISVRSIVLPTLGSKRIAELHLIDANLMDMLLMKKGNTLNSSERDSTN